MNSRERILATLTGRKSDRTPYTAGMGSWWSTYLRWKTESGIENLNIDEYFGFDKNFMHLADYSGNIWMGLNPWFEEKIIEVKERSVIRSDRFGIIKEELKSDVGECLPSFLEYPVKDWDSWKKLKEERLNPESPERFPENIEEIAKTVNESDHSIVFGSYPYGLFGTCREFMGAEALLIAFIEEPELIYDMMDHLTSLWLYMYEKTMRYIKPDSIHIWEDMSGKQGSLISPAMVTDFMLPNYKRISDFCVSHGIEVLSVDTDGNVNELVPLFMSAGVNFIFPFEVAAGSDVLEFRKQYPDLAIMGGIDKRELAKGKKEIDAQIKMVAEMIKYGRYIPCLDHLAHPEISWENYCYYNKCLKEVTGA